MTRERSAVTCAAFPFRRHGGRIATAVSAAGRHVYLWSCRRARSRGARTQATVTLVGSAASLQPAILVGVDVPNLRRAVPEGRFPPVGR